MSSRLRIGDVVLLYTSHHDGKQGIGLIKYIGSIRSASCDITKQYVGVELIEPVEHGHNGYIEGYQYFQCKQSYGIHIPITNVIRIIESSEIMLKLQDVISMFKTKLSSYIIALNERDSYINGLCINQKKYQAILSSISGNNTNHNNNPNTLNILQQQQSLTAPLTPIADSNTVREMERRQKMEHHESLTQMINKVDSVITSQSLAIKLNARQVGFDKYDRYTPLTQFSPNTYASSTPSSYTPAPNPIGIKGATPATSKASKQTMIVHDGSNKTDTGDDTEPDPLIPPRMDPIAETHSAHARNPLYNTDLPNFESGFRQNMSHNTLDTESPSQPHLLNTDTNLSTLSGHTPGPEYDDMVNNDDIHSTSSYLSAGSSAYNTPKSLTANAHRLLSSYNYTRNLSKQSISINSRPRNSSKSQKEDVQSTKKRKKRERKSSNSRSHSKSKYVPHITATGGNTPTFSASNDAILNVEYIEDNTSNRDRKKSKTKRKKSKPKKEANLRSRSDEKNRTNRSASAQFTPRSFQAIQEESEAQHQHQQPDQLPVDCPRFMGYHSTPVFNANDGYHTDDDDAMTPELPLHAQVIHQVIPPFNHYNKSDNVHINHPYSQQQRSSLPPAQPRVHRSQQRSSLPPTQPSAHEEMRHMTASRQNTIPVPNFSMYNAVPPPNPTVNRYTGSLRNIHEQNNYHRTQQQAPQLDHWIEMEVHHDSPTLAPPTHGFDNEMEEITVDAPILRHKAKSMPAKPEPRYPSRQSIDMNPYIDQQFIFQPQTSRSPHEQPQQQQYNQYHHYYGANTTNSSGTSPLNNSMTNSPQIMSQHAQQRLSNSPVMLSQQLRPPAIMTTNNNKKPQIMNKIGTVKFAPRKSVSKQLRTMSKNDQRRKSYHQQQQQLQQRQCVQTQQKQLHVRNAFNQNISSNMDMDGFTITDAMYD